MTDPGLTAGEAARRLGVAVTTLRSWHQRYGLGPTGHHPSQHRRYTPDDVARLETVRQLTAAGVPAAEAAEIALRAPAPGPPVLDDAFEPGRVARGLIRAAARLDAQTVAGIVTDAIAEHGVVVTWDEVLRPVLTHIGQRHAATRKMIDVEHLFTRALSETFAAVPRPPGKQSPRTLLACADEEQHTLPLEALAAALATVGISCRLLGARVPTPALVTAITRTGPRAVMLWSQTPGTAHPEQLSAVDAVRPRPALIMAAGSGWTDIAVPAGIDRPASITEAIAAIRTATGR